MAEIKKIELKINTNIPDTINQVKGLKESIDDTTGSTKKLKKETKDVNNDGFEKLGGSLSKLSPAFKSGIEGAKSLGTQLFILAANPIGAVVLAIVAGITLLYKAFTSTKAGGEQLERVMSGLGSVLDVLRDRVLKVGSAISKFLTGDFKGAFNEAKSAVSGFGDEIEKEFKQAAQAKKFLQEVDDAVRSLSVSRAKLNRDLARSREIITDENASYAEKKKAIEEVKLAEEKQTQAELKNAEKKLKAIKLANSLSDTSKEDLNKQAQAEAELFALQEKSASDRRAIRKIELRAEKEEQERLKSFTDELAAKSKAAADKRKKQQDEALARLKSQSSEEIKILQEKFADEKLAFEVQRQIVLKDTKLTAEDRKNLIKEINKAEKADTEKHLQDLTALQAKYDREYEDLLAKTESQRLELQKKRDFEELDRIARTEEEKIKIRASINEKYAILEKELADKTKQEELAREQEKQLKLATDIELDKNTRLQAIANREALINQIVFKSDEERTAFEKANSDARKRIAEEEFQAKQSLLNASAQGLAELSNILGAETAKGKALAVAASLINTYASIAGQLRAFSGVPIPGYAIVQAVATGLAGFSAVKNIIKVQVPGGGGAAPSAGSFAAPASAPPQFNIVGNTGINQVAQVLNKEQAPVKAFVVANDVTTQQGLDRQIKQTATLG